MNKIQDSILIFKGQSKYNVLRIAADNVSESFIEKGYNSIIYDLCNPSTYGVENDINAILENNNVVMLFSFNLLLCELLANNGNPWNILSKIPYATFLVDHPMYQDIRLMSTSKSNMYIFTFDNDNVNFIMNNYTWVKNAKFLHIPGFTAHHIPEFIDKKIDVIFTGSYNTPKNLLNEFSQYTDSLRPLAENVAEIIIDNPSLTVERALDFYIKETNLNLSKDKIKQIMTILSPVDALVRGYFRDKLVRTLLDNGIKVCVFGSGWELFEGKNTDNLIILGDGDLMTGVSYMANSKIVIGMIPWFKNGIQDRIITTMMNRSVCVTDNTPYLERNLTDNKDVVFYDINHMDELPNIITNLLKNPEKMCKIAENGFNTAMTKYNMNIFANTLLDVIKKEV